jgi:hypothetical protein
MSVQNPSQSEHQIADLIARLADGNGLVRQRARFMLVNLGQESIPALLEALKSPSVNTRLEAVKALSELPDPQTLSALTDRLMDEDIGVRWTAAESLISQGRASLRPLLENFIHNFNSPWLREGFHHVLHVFKDRDLLKKEELTLYTILNKQDFSGFEMGWTGEAAWAAEEALEALNRKDESSLSKKSLTRTS